MWRQSFPCICAGLIGLVGGSVTAHAATTVAPVHTLTIPATVQWTPTKIDVRAGVRLRVTASGTVRVMGARVWDWLTGTTIARAVGPEGTYLWPQHYQRNPAGAFPLPTMADGPSPAFALIGKIGEQGEPFYVGRQYEQTATTTGRLWLGLNDDQLADNQGAFSVMVELDPSDQTAHPVVPPAVLPRIEPGRFHGHPLVHARVILVYVDGLRPDVLQEMAEAGFLPTFKRLFLDKGLGVANAFTVFPSNTLIANGSLFTGLFSDRTGIKSQNQFERSTLKPRGQLSAWLPDGFIHKPETQVLDLLDRYAPENTHAFLLEHGVRTLATRLGPQFRFTTLPIAPLNPPPQWLHRAANTIGPFNLSNRIGSAVDQINASYAIEDLVGDPDARVIAIWLPMVDKVSHHSQRGQFGGARRDLALADQLLAQLVARVREVRWDSSTYWILVSDHGHLGGRTAVNRTCNLARDWAFRQLGCNAKVVGQEWWHPGIAAKRFIFFDNQGAGQAAIFLPYGSYFTGPWRRNRLFELTHYQIRASQGPINLIEQLTSVHPPGWDGRGARPVDLVLIKLDDERVLIHRDQDNQAILHHLFGPAGEQFQYEPIRQMTQAADGTLHWEAANPGIDPLGYLTDSTILAGRTTADWLLQPHSADEWLEATYQMRYPDALVTMAKFFTWEASLRALSSVRDPDLLLTASEGWSFRSDDDQGTDHGYPLADSMRITLWVAGPNIAHGVLAQPHRIVDVLPTILDMVGRPDDSAQLDGHAITGIYEEE